MIARSDFCLKDRLRNQKVDKVQYRHYPVKVAGLSHKAVWSQHQLENQKEVQGLLQQPEPKSSTINSFNECTQNLTKQYKRNAWLDLPDKDPSQKKEPWLGTIPQVHRGSGQTNHVVEVALRPVPQFVVKKVQMESVRLDTMGKVLVHVKVKPGEPAMELEFVHQQELDDQIYKLHQTCIAPFSQNMNIPFHPVNYNNYQHSYPDQNISIFKKTKRNIQKKKKMFFLTH